MTDNIVRISSEKNIHEYAWPILIRLQPDPCDESGCVRLRFTKNLVKNVTLLCYYFSNLGIEVKAVEKFEELPVAKNKYISVYYEVVLTRIGAIIPSGTEFVDRARAKFEEVFGPLR